MNFILKTFAAYLVIPFLAIKSIYLNAYHASLRNRKFTIPKQVTAVPNPYLTAVKRAQEMADATHQTWHVIEFTNERYIAVSGNYLIANPRKVLYTAKAK